MAARRRTSREHFGSGRLALDPAKSEFINCPYDREFALLLDAVVFATVCCGFTPRSALESGNVADSRIDRIPRAVFASKYSIHDLSRCTGEGESNLGRFNMPLDLGIAMARRSVAPETGTAHDWRLLVPEGHQYIRFLSDLAGFDPKTHAGTVESIVPNVTVWLATRPDAIQTTTPRKVLAALPSFLTRKWSLTREWGLEIPWADLVLAAMQCVPS